MGLKSVGGLWKRAGGLISGSFEFGVGDVRQKVGITLRKVENKASDKHPDLQIEIAGLWRPDAGSGKKYVASGTIYIDGAKRKLFVFPNEKEGNDKKPDFRIAIGDDDDGQGQPSDDAAPF